MLIGYARVSTEDQNFDLQRDALLRAGCEKLFEDRHSGAKSDRPSLLAALDYARLGDSLVVWRLDRLGRSLSDLIALVQRMEAAGIQLRSLTEGIDTATANGKLTSTCSPRWPSSNARSSASAHEPASMPHAPGAARAGADTACRPSAAPMRSRSTAPKTRALVRSAGSWASPNRRFMPMSLRPRREGDEHRGACLGHAATHRARRD